MFAEDRLKLWDQLAIISGVPLDQPSIERADFRDATKSFETSLSSLSWRARTLLSEEQRS